MINEEMNDQALGVVGQAAQLTYDELKKLFEKLIAKLDELKNTPAAMDKAPELIEGKQTYKQLKRHHEGLTPLELTDPNLRLLSREMKKAKIDFAVEKDGKGKYLLYFKGKDVDEMTHAFKKYTEKLVKLDVSKPSINATLTAAKAAAQALNAGRDKVKNRSKGAIDI
jgi:hypothetical protein